MAKPREDAVLAAHVVGRLDAIAERGPAQDPFLLARADQIRQVRMAMGELLDGRAAFAASSGQMGCQVVLQAGDVELFAVSDGAGVVDGGGDHRGPCPFTDIA